MFVCEGEKLVRRLFASDFAVESVLISDRFERQFGALAPPAVPIWIVPDELVEPLVGFNFHRGILACGRRLGESVAGRNGAARPAADARDLPRGARPGESRGDPEDFKRVRRGRRAYRPRLGRSISRRVLRVSMGASLRLPIGEAADIRADLHQLRDSLAIELAATVLDASADRLSTTKRSDRFALLFGSEGHGLDPAIIALCNRRLTIPMNPGTDSLNVAVAAGIFLHHLCGEPVRRVRSRQTFA